MSILVHQLDSAYLLLQVLVCTNISLFDVVSWKYVKILQIIFHYIKNVLGPLHNSTCHLFQVLFQNDIDILARTLKEYQYFPKLYLIEKCRNSNMTVFENMYWKTDCVGDRCYSRFIFTKYFIYATSALLSKTRPTKV